MGYQREIINDAITTHLVNLFEYNEDIRVRWKEHEADSTGQGKVFKVYRDMQDQLLYTPAIEIVSQGRETEIFSIGTQEDHFNYDILCTVNNNHPEFSAEYMRIFANSIQDILNDFSSRNFIVPGYSFCVYYSEARDMEYGYRRGKGLRSARISWMAKLLKPNRFGTSQ